MFVGWDVSTSVIGVAVLDQSGSLIYSDHLDLTKLEPNVLEKADFAEPFVKSISQKFPSSSNFVEDRLGGFSRGFSSAQTLMTLASFNSLVSWMIKREFGNVRHLHLATIKSEMQKEGLVIPKKSGGEVKKSMTLDFVRKREPTFPLVSTRTGKPKPHCYDRADAYVVALTGLRKHRNDRVQKALSSEKSSRSCPAGSKG